MPAVGLSFRPSDSATLTEKMTAFLMETAFPPVNRGSRVVGMEQAAQGSGHGPELPEFMEHLDTALRYGV